MPLGELITFSERDTAQRSAAKLRPRVTLLRRVWSTASRVAEARGRQLQWRGWPHVHHARSATLSSPPSDTSAHTWMPGRGNIACPCRRALCLGLARDPAVQHAARDAVLVMRLAEVQGVRNLRGVAAAGLDRGVGWSRSP